MELWQLRTFSAVAKNLHFTRAAEELNLSQPAVSHQIKLLEEEIGEPLFLREKEGVSLTRAGQTMYQHARKILDIADQMRLEIKENEDVLSGKIVLGMATRGLGNTFPRLYENFKKMYPDIEIFVQAEAKLVDIVEKVRDGKIDIGMVVDNLDLSGLEVIPYAEFEVVLVAGANHPLAEKEEITIEDIQNKDWVMFETENRLRVWQDDFLSRAGIIPKSIYETNDGSLVRAMVFQGNRLTTLPKWGVFSDIEDGKIVLLNVKGLKKHKVPINLIWKNSRRTKIMTAVLTFLLEKQFEGVQLIKKDR